MAVKIIGITQSLIEGIETKDLVAYVARISNPNNQMNTQTSDKLLKYLLDNAHFSPFEMVNILVEIKTTRDIARQILRHRSFTFQEYSQRYAKVEEDFIYKEARIQDKKNRQNSFVTDDQQLKDDWLKQQEMVGRVAHDAYEWALYKGIAKEQARAVLPEGLTPTTLIMNGTLRSFIHYCQLRSGHGTQQEHIDIAKEIWQEIIKIFTVLSEVYKP